METLCENLSFPEMLAMSQHLCLGFDPMTWNELHLRGRSELHDDRYRFEKDNHTVSYASHRYFQQFAPVDCFDVKSKIFVCV